LQRNHKARTRGAVTYKALVKQYCNVEIGKEEQTGFRYGVPLTKAQKEYAHKDVKYLPEIYEQQQVAIKNLWLDDIIKTEMDCLPVMVWLELSGLFLNIDKLHELEAEYFKIRAEALKNVFEVIGHDINMNSPKQVKEALNKLGIPAENASKKHLITFSQYSVVRSVMEFKSMEKLFSSFVNKLPDRIHPTTGRIHADFRQFGARSGRMSCTKSNLQQQPSKDIEIKDKAGKVVKKLVWRDVYTARSGYKIITSDYNQMELRILAQASLEPKFIQAFNEELDLHLMTAEMINKEKIDPESPDGIVKRKAAKKVNFGIPYGVTKFGLLYQLQAELIPCTEEEADGMIKIHRVSYPVLHEYLDKMDFEAIHNLQVRNLAGRLIVYTDPKVTTKKEAERRKATIGKPTKSNAKPLMPLDKYRRRLIKQIGNNGKNNPIQSLGVDILKIALKGVYDRLNNGAVNHISGNKQIFLVNVVHDEIVLEVPEEMAEYTAQVVKEEMEKAGEQFIKVVKCPVKPVIADCWKK
jgi:DNA polymerase I